jgi:integrase
MRRFSFSTHKRGNIYYAQFWNPKTKKYTSAKSTGATSKRVADGIAVRWISEGIPFGKSSRSLTETLNADTLFDLIHRVDLNTREAERIAEILTDRGLLSSGQKDDEPFIGWLFSFWDFDSSPYVADKLAHGHQISRRRCKDMRSVITKHWREYFGEKTRSEIAIEDLRAFGRNLYEKNLAAKTINNVMSAGTVPLHWAHESGIITADPTQGLKSYSGAKRKRGILSESEAAAILALPWKDERARVGNLLASKMGLRAGEILGLRVQDLGTTKLYVRHAWSATDGLKGTKTDQERHLLFAPGIREELVKLAESNPHGTGPGMFVFWSTLPDRPMDNHVLLDSLKEQFVRLKVGTDASDEEKRNAMELRKERNIVVHSWRHYVASQLRARGVPLNLAMDYLGHESREVHEAYADHETETGDKVLSGAMGWNVPA